MNGGTISGNTGTSSGGGVFVGGGNFTMSGGEISGNTSLNLGGGVHVMDGTFTMNGGTISDNTAYNGGGVYVSTTFTMSGGEISGNTSSMYGGGVYVDIVAVFTMRGGKISGNICSNMGGGVFVNYINSNFTKIGGGTIYGYTSGDASSNVANSSNIVNHGHAVYVYDTPVKRRETTAGPTVNLDSTKNGAAGGWE
jgi:hypothetical protein